ncbi:MAG: chromosome partitioning protein ParA [Desulfurivibrio sp.]|nr:MAG: chromosome partitioning protein ParA [Desulfurivibrio sp.]
MLSADEHDAGHGQTETDQASHGGKTCGTCGDTGCSASRRQVEESEEEFAERRKLAARLCRISHKVAVLSGKGGVGKSTVAVNLAVALMMAGKRVGLLDVDFHGPSIPTMLGLEGAAILADGNDLLPVERDGLKVMSLGFLLKNPDDAVIWRGPMKIGVIRQLLADVAWGELDFLIIDSPPGTGDEPLTVCQLIEGLDGAVIVTTPQKVATVDVRKSITFCRELGVRVLGVVENMSGFACPRCGEVSPLLSTGGGRGIALSMQVPFLGSIPMDPMVTQACDNGCAFVRDYAASPTARIMREIIETIAALDQRLPEHPPSPSENENREDRHMRIVIPLADGRLTSHFGHCASFALVDVDQTSRQIVKREDIAAPPHQPGLLPSWLSEQGANLIIAGGMGQKARELFIEQGIQVMVGAMAETPEKLAGDYLAGTLQLGQNSCDH